MTDISPITDARYTFCFPFVAEDDAAFRFLLERSFVKSGVHKCRMVSDGQEAIDALGNVSPGGILTSNAMPSFIVLDIQMPRKSGFEVLTWIRGRTEFDEVPVFVLTSDEANRERALKLGANSFYVKPHALAEIVKVVEGMLSLWYTQVERRLPDLSGS